MLSDYEHFISNRSQIGWNHGFSPTWLSPHLFGFQEEIARWSIETGRSLVMADCGLGKSLVFLTWAENVVRHTNKPVLILAPCAVAPQIVREAAKFGIEAYHSRDGKPCKNITVTNYEQLHKFNWQDFGGIVCDEAGILKNFKGKLKNEIIAFMRKIAYRLLATATAAPNDYIELGNHSEALGGLGFMDMLNKYFKNDQNNSKVGRHRGVETKFRLKGHAEIPFWQYIASFSRAVRKPSDIGFSDGDFILPPLTEVEHVVEARRLADGMLFALPAIGLKEEREERRRTIEERCEYAANLVNGTGKPFISWCHLNDEGDMLERLIPDAIQISGRDSDERKEEKFLAFVSGEARGIITKCEIGAWGLNFQHCNHMTAFPSHSFEQYYQMVRRCWRFGQKLPVTVDMVTTEGEQRVIKNHQRKAKKADALFSNLIIHMNNAIQLNKVDNFNKTMEVAKWL